MMVVTPDRLNCLAVVLQAGGSIDHEDPRLAPFCDDGSTLTTPDVFNQCHDAGWLESKYNSLSDSSVARLTPEGREVIAAIART